MATVTGYTAARMKEIEDTTVIDGDVVGDELILVKRNGVPINAGNVRGAQGDQGIPGTPGADSPVQEAALDGKAYARKDGLWVPSTPEALVDGKTYGRKDGAWIAAPPEAPIDGKSYARKDGAWTNAPGVLLGNNFNDTDSTTSAYGPTAMGGGGTAVTVAVGARGVSVNFGLRASHSSAGVQLYAVLFVDGASHTFATTTLSTATGHSDAGRTVVFGVGALVVANHTFEVRVQQGTAAATLSIWASWISVWAN